MKTIITKVRLGVENTITRVKAKINGEETYVLTLTAECKNGKTLKLNKVVTKEDMLKTMGELSKQDGATTRVTYTDGTEEEL